MELLLMRFGMIMAIHFQILLEKARLYADDPKIGDIVERELEPSYLGRIAAKTAEQALKQRLWYPVRRHVDERACQSQDGPGDEAVEVFWFHEGQCRQCRYGVMHSGPDYAFLGVAQRCLRLANLCWHIDATGNGCTPYFGSDDLFHDLCTGG